MSVDALLPPRILVIDVAGKGNGTPTGSLMETLFGDWQEDRFMLIHAYAPDGLAMSGAKAFAGRHSGLVEDGQATEIAKAFAPQLLLYRPSPDLPYFHLFAMGLIGQINAPLVVWMTDDWPTGMALRRPSLATCFDQDIRWLLGRATVRLGVGEALCAALTQRYEVPFLPFGKGVDPLNASTPTNNPRRPFTLRYDDFPASRPSMDSLLMLAQAVELLNADGVTCRLEINMKTPWPEGPARLEPFTHAVLSAFDHGQTECTRWLAAADTIVVAYDFDEASSIGYSHSMMIGLPDMLASGVPLLAVGPGDHATIRFIEEQGCGAVIGQPDVAGARNAIARLMADPIYRLNLVRQAGAVAATQFDISRIRHFFTRALSDAAAPAGPQHQIISDTHARPAHASLDETEVIARLFDRISLSQSHPIMLDVGAHFGSSSQYFVNRGWRIFCFEPDPANRAKLENRYKDVEQVSIHPDALGEAEQEAMPFFGSTQSTGISSLLAFHDTHACINHVKVTTIDAFTTEQGIAHVNFLKIDAEGWDFKVLKGVPWHRLRPDVIECEFEDAKTIHLGYRIADMADYLQNLGYHVYVSEWHPIIQYGVRHDWCRLSAYPTALRDDRCWGNLLAFRTDPGPTAINHAIDRCLKVRSPTAITWTRETAAHVTILTADKDLLFLPEGRPIWIFGAGPEGEIMLKVLRAQNHEAVLGFLDTYRRGEHCGLPVRRFSDLAPYDMAPVSIIIANPNAREIIRRMRMLPQNWLYDATPLLKFKAIEVAPSNLL